MECILQEEWVIETLHQLSKSKEEGWSIRFPQEVVQEKADMIWGKTEEVDILEISISRKRSADDSDEGSPKTKVRRVGSKKPRWTREEDMKLLELKRKLGDLSWAKIAQHMDERSPSQCYQRWHRVLNPSILKGPWSKEETEILSKVVRELQMDKISWSQVAKHIPGRTDIQCRYQFLKLVRSGKGKLYKRTNWDENKKNSLRKKKTRSYESSDEEFEDEEL
eukprot:TRINITY_DN2878_c0_g1_i1.p1 TRINITY_DN2878_c0_g1~~TRINITY_DN2878_c0_g1_i1.p1  ORF type:complete len:222 (-),score=60.22 TRINITY_DN2878_c0_g1_i1:186-851(-)